MNKVLYMNRRLGLTDEGLASLLKQKGFAPSKINPLGNPLQFWERLVRNPNDETELVQRIEDGKFQYGYDEWLRYPKSCCYRAEIFTFTDKREDYEKIELDRLSKLREELSDIFEFL